MRAAGAASRPRCSSSPMWPRCQVRSVCGGAVTPLHCRYSCPQFKPSHSQLTAGCQSVAAGIVGASCGLPDLHSGYAFAIGDPAAGLALREYCSELGWSVLLFWIATGIGSEAGGRNTHAHNLPGRRRRRPRGGLRCGGRRGRGVPWRRGIRHQLRCGGGWSLQKVQCFCCLVLYGSQGPASAQPKQQRSAAGLAQACGCCAPTSPRLT